MATVTDTYTSTDGAAHTLDLLYETDLEGSTSAWELPGEGAFRHRETEESAGAPSAPGTVYATNNPALEPSFTNQVAAMTFGTPYNSVSFDNTLWADYGPSGEQSALFDYRRTVPAGGSVAITWSYATGTSLAEVQGDAAAALVQMRDQAQPPTISISAPASGARLSGETATVSGTASAGSGVKSVTIDGSPATVSGSSFGARVALTPGVNVITATATSFAGNTATTQVAVADEPSSPTALPSALTPARPRVESAWESTRRWREGSAKVQISRARKSSAPVGTFFSFELNEAATVRLAFTQTARGRMVSRHCVTPKPRNRPGRACARTSTTAAMSFAGHAGTNTVHFAGRVARSRELKPARYTLVITATNAMGRSTPQHLTFTIVK